MLELVPGVELQPHRAVVLNIRLNACIGEIDDWLKGQGFVLSPSESTIDHPGPFLRYCCEQLDQTDELMSKLIGFGGLICKLEELCELGVEPFTYWNSSRISELRTAHKLK